MLLLLLLILLHRLNIGLTLRLLYCSSINLILNLRLLVSLYIYLRDLIVLLNLWLWLSSANDGHSCITDRVMMMVINNWIVMCVSSSFASPYNASNYGNHTANRNKYYNEKYPSHEYWNIIVNWISLTSITIRIAIKRVALTRICTEVTIAIKAIIIIITLGLCIVNEEEGEAKS